MIGVGAARSRASVPRRLLWRLTVGATMLGRVGQHVGSGRPNLRLHFSGLGREGGGHSGQGCCPVPAVPSMLARGQGRHGTTGGAFNDEGPGVSPIPAGR